MSKKTYLRYRDFFSRLADLIKSGWRARLNKIGEIRMRKPKGKRFSSCPSLAARKTKEHLGLRPDLFRRVLKTSNGNASTIPEYTCRKRLLAVFGLKENKILAPFP